jgi:hypothetical protein
LAALSKRGSKRLNHGPAFRLLPFNELTLKLCPKLSHPHGLAPLTRSFDQEINLAAASGFLGVAMLCHLCSDIDLDQVQSAAGYRHHFSGIDLCTSAKNGCIFCAIIVRAYGNDSNAQLDVRNLGQIILRNLGRFIVDSNGGMNPKRDLTGLTVAGCKLGQVLLFTTRGG